MELRKFEELTETPKNSFNLENKLKSSFTCQPEALCNSLWQIAQLGKLSLRGTEFLKSAGYIVEDGRAEAAKKLDRVRNWGGQTGKVFASSLETIFRDISQTASCDFDFVVKTNEPISNLVTIFNRSGFSKIEVRTAISNPDLQLLFYRDLGAKITIVSDNPETYRNPPCTSFDNLSGDVRPGQSLTVEFDRELPKTLSLIDSEKLSGFYKRRRIVISRFVRQASTISTPENLPLRLKLSEDETSLLFRTLEEIYRDIRTGHLTSVDIEARELEVLCTMQATFPSALGKFCTEAMLQSTYDKPIGLSSDELSDWTAFINGKSSAGPFASGPLQNNF